MKVPSRNIELPGGLRCPATIIGQAPWIAHVVKHPLGLQGITGRPLETPWNREGWDALDPPLIDAAERHGLVQRIAGLEARGRQCGVPEVGGASTVGDPDREACYLCPTPLASQCARVLEGVSERYAAVTSTLVESFEVPRCVEVPRCQMIKRLTRLFGRYELWSSLAILSVGLDGRQRALHVARVARADGVRTEFYVAQGELRWRTTWRHPPVHPAQAMSFLLDFAPSAPTSVALSEVCLVDRLWWQRHGI